MKTVLALVVLALSALAADQPEKDVLRTLEEWKKAALAGDAATLGKLYHPDLAYTHSNGSTQDKAATVGAQSNPTNIYKGIAITDLDVHVYGKTAILRYKLDLTHYAGDTAHLHEVMVWLETSQGWQMVTRHATRIPPAPAK